MWQLFFILLVIAIVGVIVWHKIVSADTAGHKKKMHRSHLVSVLLHLDERSMAELFDLYKKEFGPGPARYARKTYRKWKSGEVTPATQTFRRFLLHLPEVMSFDLKCEVLRLFMEEYAKKDAYALEVTSRDWEEKLTPLVHQIIDKAYTATLPAEIERKLRWLGEGGMEAAQHLLRHSQAEESRIVVSMLREEIKGIEMMLEEQHLDPKVRHTLKFPYGTIDLNFKRG